MSCTITIFTPTYNRIDRLIRLKESLDKQTDLDFLWFLVDDGSKDGTEKAIHQFMNDSKFPMIYSYQENQGKHVAHNYAVSHCETELFYCVDSDDKLPENAVENIKRIWENVENKKDVSGIVGLKAYFDYKIIGGRYPENVEQCQLGKLYSDYGKQGDTALIWRTEVIREYPFKVFHKEKFLRENTAYDLIDEKYDLVVSNEILYLVEYCEDGLSRNATQIELKNPLGAAYYRYGKALKAKNLYQKIGYLSGFVFYCRLGKKEKEARKQLGIIKYFIFFILSKMMRVRYRLRGIQID